MKKRGLLCLLSSMIMLMSAACGTTDSAGQAGTTADETVIMRIDDREILKSEYMVYLYTTTMNFISVGGEDIFETDIDGQDAYELLEEQTINTLRMLIATARYAKENGIELSDAVKEEAVTMAESFISQVSAEELAKMDITLEELVPYMEESYLFSMVYQQLASECVVDTEAMQAYYKENEETLYLESTYAEMDSIVVEDEALAKEITARARSGEDFLELFMEYDMDENAKMTEDGGYMMLYGAQYASAFGDEFPAEGTITDPIFVDDVYFIFKMNSVVVPTEDELISVSNYKFTSEKQTEYSEARIDELVKAQKVERYDDVFATVEHFR